MIIKKTHAIFILDESGSMGSIREETIQAFNQQVETIKENSEKVATEVTLVTFNTEVNEPIHWKQPADSLVELTEKDFIPNGMTALYDAVGTTISKFQKDPDYDDEAVTFLVIIVTDGLENNSKEYGQSLPALIKDQEANGRWTFTYLGANQDVLAVAKAMNINASNASQYVATAQGVGEASKGLTRGISTYFSATSTGQTQVQNFYNPKED